MGNTEGTNQERTQLSDERKKYLIGSPSFSLNLYRKIVERHPGNVLLSPFCVLAALSAMKEGTKHNTAEELKKALTIEELYPDEQIYLTFLSYDQVCLNMKTNIGTYYPNPNVTLYTANAIYYPERFNVNQSYILSTNPNLARHQPIVKIKPLKKVRLLDAYQDQINAYVDEATDSNITDCIPEDFLIAGDQVLISCAIYLKSDWAKIFNVRDTCRGLFHRSATDSTPTFIMRTTAWLHYAKSSDFNCQIIRLVHGCSKLSMFILLPDEIEGLVSLEEKLSPGALYSLMEAMSEEEVSVEMPKFHLDFGLTMREVLKSVGIKDMFCYYDARLGGLSSKEGLYVCDFYHRALFDYSEEATDDVERSSSVFDHFSPVFKADHPFMFFILHDDSKIIISVGRFTDTVTILTL